MRGCFRFLSPVVVVFSVLLMALGPDLQGEEEQEKEKTKNPPSGYYDIESPQASAILKKFPKVIVLDIRTPREYQGGHLKNAKNIDFFEDNFGAEIGKLDKKKAYLVHCASGGRSGRSMAQFKELGFTTIYHLADGYKGWVKANLPVETK